MARKGRCACGARACEPFAAGTMKLNSSGEKLIRARNDFDCRDTEGSPQISQIFTDLKTAGATAAVIEGLRGHPEPYLCSWRRSSTQRTRRAQRKAEEFPPSGNSYCLVRLPHAFLCGPLRSLPSLRSKRLSVQLHRYGSGTVECAMSEFLFPPSEFRVPRSAFRSLSLIEFKIDVHLE